MYTGLSQLQGVLKKSGLVQVIRCSSYYCQRLSFSDPIGYSSLKELMLEKSHGLPGFHASPSTAYCRSETELKDLGSPRACRRHPVSCAATDPLTEAPQSNPQHTQIGNQCLVLVSQNLSGIVSFSSLSPKGGLLSCSSL